MNHQIKLLFNHRPTWVNSVQSARNSLNFKAALKKAGGEPHPTLHLEVFLKDGRPAAKEFSNHQWPKFCPERHINEDGDFCLGVDSLVPAVSNLSSAKAWWKTLADYLQLQFVANDMERWPLRNAHPHGQAGNIQAKLEDEISNSSINADIEFIELRKFGILQPQQEARLIHDSKKYVINGRNPCLFF